MFFISFLTSAGNNVESKQVSTSEIPITKETKSRVGTYLISFFSLNLNLLDKELVSNLLLDLLIFLSESASSSRFSYLTIINTYVKNFEDKSTLK